VFRRSSTLDQQNAALGPAGVTGTFSECVCSPCCGGKRIAPHSLQNFEFGGNSAPHDPHTTAAAKPGADSQTLESAPVESVGFVFRSWKPKGMLMKPGTELTAIHPAVEAGVNNQDIDGLMALYAEDASMVLVDGSIVTGLPAIREEWAGLLAMNGHITLRSRFAIAAGDLAVLSNEWTFELGGEQISSVTAEVARRQPDGGWLYVIDHPYAGSEPDELATIMAAMEALAT
jgi:ketosteroid isomerase-like protein